MRQIAPEIFEPVYRDPNAPPHKPPPPPPAAPKPPKPLKPEPAPPPSRARPYGACAPEAANFVVCLGEAAERADREAWRALRDRECADLPLIENGLVGSLYERRLICRIRRDVDRAEFLRQRYGGRG